MSFMRQILAFGAVVTLFASIPLGAKALSLDWSSTEEVMAPSLSASGPNGESRIISDSSGNLTAIWTTGNQFQAEIFYSTKAAGSVWSQPAPIPQAGPGASWPELAVSTDGTVLAVWSFISSGQFYVEASTKQWGAAWSAPELISTEINQLGSLEPSVVFDMHGKFVVTWAQSTNSFFNGQNVTIIGSSEYDLTSQSWSAYQSLGEMGPWPYGLRLSAGYDGSVSLVWSVLDPTANFGILRYMSRDVNGTWGTATDLSPQSQSNENPNVYAVSSTMFDQNNATVVWSCIVSICARVLDDGVWGPTQVLASSENGPIATTTPDGTVTVVFQDGTGWSLSDFVSLTRPVHGSWSAPTHFGEQVTGVGQRMLSLATSSDGVITFAWANIDYSTFPGSRNLSAVYKTDASSSWTSATRLQTSNNPWSSIQYPYLTAGANGSILAIWDNNENGSATYSAQLDMSYSLTYSLNYGTGTLPTGQTYLRGSSGLTISPGAGIALGSREFVSWNTAPDGSGNTINPGQALSLTADTILYAQFTPVTTYPSPTPTSSVTGSSQTDPNREASLAITGLNSGLIQIVGVISSVFTISGILFVILRSRRNRQLHKFQDSHYSKDNPLDH